MAVESYRIPSRRRRRLLSAAVVGLTGVSLLAFDPVPVAAAGCGINGTSGNNTLNGTAGNDVICGHGGNDVIYGHGGNDTIYGGTGADTVYGGTGNDWIAGEDSADRLLGEDGVDTMYGGASDDTIYAGGSGDVVHGEAGNDSIKGEPGNDTLYGDAGLDKIWGDQDADTLLGGPDADTVYGGPGNDALRGEGGNDTLDGEGETDDVRGGPNTDTCKGGAGYTDTIHDFECEHRSGAERLYPGYNGSDLACGPNDTSCLAFSGFAGQSVAGFPLCYMHNCTAYAAYRLSRRGLTEAQIPDGDAYEWNNTAGGLTVVLNTSPAPGDIAQWESLGGASNDCGGINCGHVAYVERVGRSSTGALTSITISESKWCTGGDVRTIAVGAADWPSRFLRWS